MRSALIAAALALAGCAATPTPDPWADYEPHDEPVAAPIEHDGWPEPIAYTDETVTFDLNGALALESWRIAGLGNYEIASELMHQVIALREENDALVRAGRAQRQVAEFRRQMLEDERRAHAIEKITLWAGMVLVVVGAAAF